tara:strand:- start:92 stop:382 length:291 start_codon:yes stop_codon:yes gene_type:complete
VKELIMNLCKALSLTCVVTKKGTGLNIFGLDAVVERQLPEDVVTFMNEVRELGKNVTFFPPSPENLEKGLGGCIYIGKSGMQSATSEEIDACLDKI